MDVQEENEETNEQTEAASNEENTAEQSEEAASETVAVQNEAKAANVREAGEEFTVDNIKYTTTDGTNECYVSGNDNAEGPITIPATVVYNDITYMVKYIGDSAFNRNQNIISLTIAQEIESIDDYAFNGCNGFDGILMLNDGLKSIGNSAFSQCTGIKGSLEIPSRVRSIDKFTFNNCRNLKGALTIPASVTSIGESAFNGCTGLEAINVDENNRNYSSDAGMLLNKEKTRLMQCPGGKQGSVTIPLSLTSIDGYAFYGCSNLKCALFISESDSITWGNNVFENAPFNTADSGACFHTTSQI